MRTFCKLQQVVLFLSLVLLLVVVSWMAVAAAPVASHAFSCANVTGIPQNECEALVALYNSTNGPGWASNTGWLTTNDPCGWTGVTCQDGRVKALELHNNSLSGTIPPQLGNLANLQELSLGGNALSGAIPPELGNLASLQSLTLAHNALSGAIPPELGKLANLHWLYLRSNNLSGAIPPQLGNLVANLYDLDLWNNHLSGAIPPQLGNLANLRRLVLAANGLSGTIPPDLGNLANLDALGLSGNRLSGAIPPELSNLANVELLALSYNALAATDDPALLAWLAQRQPDWAETQTVAPIAVQASVLADRIVVSWTPIRYTGDGGYYEISYATALAGPFTVHGVTPDKTSNQYTLTGLAPSPTYFVRVRTYTPSHLNNLNELWSDYSEVVRVLMAAGVNDRYDVTKDKALYVGPPGVLANDINANGNPRVYALTQDDSGVHVTEQAWYDYSWHSRDITAEAIPAAAPAPELGALASLSVNGAPRVYYKSRWIDTTRVIELAWHDDDKVWKWRDLTTEAISSVPPQAMDLASPVVATTVNSNPRVYYLGTDGHVYELAWVVDHWYRRDVTSDTNAPAAVSGALVATTITHDDPRVYYLDVQGHVHELAWRTLSQVWYHRDLMANAERTPAAGRALAATTANLEPRVYYLGADQHVYEFAWFSYEWHWRDVTADMRNEGINVPNAIADSPLRVTTVGSRGDPRVYFLSEGQKGRHLQELAWFNDQWNYTDLTGKIPNAQGVDQSPFAVVMVKLDPLVYYFGTDQHLHELAWRSDQWVDTAIGALPPSLLGPLSATTAQETPLSARLVSNVAHGNLALYEDGSFVYVPNQGFPAGYVDHDSFTYVATTGSTESVATTVELDVTDECFPVDNNSLINFCFADGREPWKFWDNGSEGAYDISTDNPFAGATSAMATVRASGGNIQFYQAGLALQPKTSYELSFAAYAEDGRDMDLYVHRHGPSAPYTSYGLCARHVNLEPYWKHFTLTFTTPDLPKMDDARLRFWLAPYATAGTVYHIDRVVLRPSGEPPATPDLCPWEAPIVPPPDHCDPMPPDTVIQNPGFEGTQAPWRFYTNGAGLFTLDTNHYECSQAAKITVSGAGSNVQLYQAGIALQPNTTYRLRLAARSNSGHDIALFVHQHGAPYTNYGIEGVPLDLTPAWKVFTIQFTTRNFTTPVTDARLRLWLAPYATAGDEYWFDDIVMQPLAVAASAVQPATMTGNAEVTSELLVEGSFIDDDNRGLLAGAEVPDISLMEQQNYIFLPLISED